MNKKCLEHCPRIRTCSEAVDEAVAAATTSDPTNPERYAEHARAIMRAGRQYLEAALDSLQCSDPKEISVNAQTGDRKQAGHALVSHVCSLQDPHSRPPSPQA